MLKIRILTSLAVLTLLTSCALFKEKPARLGKPIDWSNVPGWSEDAHSEVWPALINNCMKMHSKPFWDRICPEITSRDSLSDSKAKALIESWFQPHYLYSGGKQKEGLITGYYEPLLHGSYKREGKYQYPLYRQPDDLLIIDLGDLYPDLKNRRLRGKIQGNRVVPYFSREDIETTRSLLEGNELIWLDDRDDVFFLHIQGSGRIQLPDGNIIGAGYSNQNGHPYVSIGKVLIQRGEMEREQISLFTLRQWLDDNPDKAEELLNENPSYVFFVLRDNPGEGPVGSLNVPLTAQRSIAIDPKIVSLGTPVWLMTNYPGKKDSPYRRLVMAQDTGGAIKGIVRADLFWGHGTEAEKAAGVMNEKGSLIVLMPKTP